MAQEVATIMDQGFAGWQEVRTAVYRVTSNQLKDLDPRTIANALDVITVCESRTKLPSGLKRGYWATVVLWWEGFELEVFEDRVEVYRFRADNGTDIWYEDHTSGGSFTARFLDELVTLAPA